MKEHLEHQEAKIQRILTKMFKKIVGESNKMGLKIKANKTKNTKFGTINDANGYIKTEDYIFECPIREGN